MYPLGKPSYSQHLLFLSVGKSQFFYRERIKYQISPYDILHYKLYLVQETTSAPTFFNHPKKIEVRPNVLSRSYKKEWREIIVMTHSNDSTVQEIRT